MRDFWEWLYYLGGSLGACSFIALIFFRSVWTTGKQARNFAILMGIGILAVLASDIFG